MAFTPDQLLSYLDLVVLINTEGYIMKNNFPVTEEVVTKVQIIDALWLDGNPPLVSYVDNQHVRYEDIAPLGTAWVGGDWVCDDGAVPDIPTPPTLVDSLLTTASSITFNWNANPGTTVGNITGYTLELAADTPDNWFNQVFVIGSTREYTYTNLDPFRDWYVRAKSHNDSVPSQESVWSNYLLIKTLAISYDILTLTLVKLGNSADQILFKADGPAGDTITLQLTVTSAGTIDPADNWYYHKTAEDGLDTKLVYGSDSPTIPSVYTWDFVCDGDEQTVGKGGSTRTPVNFYGWSRGTVEIIATTGVTPLPPAISADVTGSSATP